MTPFSFLGPSQQDPSAQQGLNQYIQQGQSQISPGQAAIAGSNPISAAALQNLAKSLQQQPQQPLPAQQPVSPDASQMALANPIGGQAGPTPQNLQLAQALQQNPQLLTQQMNNQNFMQGGQ
jgi:hypothetical protein